MRSDTMPLSAVDDYAETVLAPQISQMPGIAQVLVYGAQKFAVRVQVDPVAAAARNISLDDIRSVVAKANSSTPVGTLQGEKQAMTLLATGAMRQRRRLPRRGRGLSQRRAGQARPGRAASSTASRTTRSPPGSTIRAPSCWRSSASPTPTPSTVVDLVRDALPAMRAQIPPAIEMAPLFDRSISIRAAVDRRAGDAGDRHLRW